MKKQMKITLAMSFVFLISNPVFAHEGHNDAFSQNTVDTKVQKIEISPEGEKAIGLKVAPIKLSNVRKYLKATGQVVADDNEYADLSVPISGFVTKVYVKEGDRVSRGQTLALLRSVEATSLLKDLLDQNTDIEKEITILTKQAQLQKINYEREKTLLAEGISSKKDYLTAEAEYENIRTSLKATERQQDLIVNAAKSQLSIMGIGEGAVNQALDSGIIRESVSIAAPISGLVSFRDITVGKAIQPGNKIFSIVNLSPIWVIADLYQDQIPLIKQGLEVNISSASGEEIKGYISNIGAVVDETRRTLPVRIVCDNPNQTLKPGMTVTTKILYGKGEELMSIVPQSAIIKDGEKSIVYVKYDTYYQPVEVKLGSSDSSEVEVLDGLYEGDLVVVQGAEQLHSKAILSSKETKPSKEKNISELFSSWKFILSLLATALLTSLIWILVLKLKARRNKNV